MEKGEVICWLIFPLNSKNAVLYLLNGKFEL